MRKNSKTGLPKSDRFTASEMRRGVLGKYSHGTGIVARAIVLDEDVAKDFATSKEVNEALRLVKQIQQLPRKTKKSA